jgi:hypothetical protein
MEKIFLQKNHSGRNGCWESDGIEDSESIIIKNFIISLNFASFINKLLILEKL